MSQGRKKSVLNTQNQDAPDQQTVNTNQSENHVASNDYRQSESKNRSKAKKDDEVDDEDAEIEDEKNDQPLTRKDECIVFEHEKDLRHLEPIAIKASLYKGIAVKVKILNHVWIENVLLAIEQAKDRGIVTLRFSECRILKKAVSRLLEFLKNTQIIESFGLDQVTFDDGQDFKRLVEAVSQNVRIKQFQMQHAEFDEDYHGKTVSRCILESRSLKELDLSYTVFDDPKSFYEMANGLLNEKCRLLALKLKGIVFGQLEGKVMTFILMRNKSLQTLDLSECSTDSPEILDSVFCRFDQVSNIRTLIAENLVADFNYIVESFGEALGLNTKLEGLSIKGNKMKQSQYCNFWGLMAENRSLRKINVSATEVTDRVCQNISAYLVQSEIKLSELNLSKNLIGADGLLAIAEALLVNNSLITLNLEQNNIKDLGIPEFVTSLCKNTTLQELCLRGNKINNTGLISLSGFLARNSTVKVLDIGKNAFTDIGFIQFAQGIAHNTGIENLSFQKNKDVTDEIGLRELAIALSTNSALSIIDLTGLKPALKKNISLKRIIGKIPPGIIGEDLKDNIIIEVSIASKSRTIKNDNKRELAKLPIHQIGCDQTLLFLRGQSPQLISPALKFIGCKKIHFVDLSKMQLEDEALRLLAVYLEENPCLRSLSIGDNNFTDDGLGLLISALKENTNLNHLNLLGCHSFSDISLQALEETVREINMSLYVIEIDRQNLNEDLLESLMSQTQMNRAIQEHLRPQKIIRDNLVEIAFAPKAKVAQHFDSAIKSWRILGPQIISVVNAGLSDGEVVQLCQFLSGKNQIKSLNLRRNKIGNTGAIAISEYVKKDRSLISLELERNQIEDEGGEALLSAMQGNMRMEYFKMTYGNPLKSKICRQIEREIKANLQIKATVIP